MKKQNHKNSAFCILNSAFSDGFSLVEISLALLVVGIGMLAILSMFPAGLDQNVRSIGDTHAGLFAGEVFSSLRVCAETNWDGIGTTIPKLPVAAGADNLWDNPGSLDIKLDNEIHANVYSPPDNPGIVDHAFRYRVTLATNGLIKSASLCFWPGQFGSSSNPAVFYAEFYKMNR